MLTYFKRIFLIGLITIFFLEVIGILLSKLSIIPKGSPAVISVFANSKWSYWHPKKISFTHHYNTCWPPAKIYFNNIGARGKEDVEIKKSRPRIALLGDSMIEMIHVNEGQDIASLMRKKLPNFEIINFSSRAMGLYDQLDIYRNLIRKYNIDYLMLFITENDFDNNFIESYKPDEVFNQPKFYFDENQNKVIKINRNSEKFKNYFSPYNNLKRSKIILYLKNYSYTFKLYFHIKVLIRNNKIKKSKKNFDINQSHKSINSLENTEKVYDYLIKEFISEIKKDNVILIPILNLRSYLFKKEKNLNYQLKIKLASFNIMKKLWEPYNILFFLDEAKIYIEKNKDKIIEPYLYLGHICDDHYSKFGSEFMSLVSYNYFYNKYLN